MAKTNVEIKFKIDGLDTYIDDLETLDSVLKQVKDSTADVEKETDKMEGSMGKFGNGLRKIGSLGKAAFKGIGTAIKATGIGFLVGIIAKLVEQFTKTDTGAKILQGTLAVLGVVFERIEKVVNFLFEYLVAVFENPQKAVDDFKLGVEALSGWFSSLGDYIKNNFLLLIQNLQKELLEVRIKWNEWTGDTEEAELLRGELLELENQMKDTRKEIEEAAEEVAEPFIEAAAAIKQVVTEIVDDAGKAIDASNKAIDTAARFATLQNELLVQNAELNKELETQKKIAEDTTRSYDERKTALQEVNKANEQLAENALKEAQANEDLIRQQLELASNDEDRRALQAELAAATAERITKEQEAEIVRLESAQLNRELDQEEVDRQQSINDIKQSLRLENIKNEREAEYEALRLAEEATLRELDNLKATEEEKQAVRDEFAKKRKDLDAKSADDAIKLAKEEAEARQMIADKAFGVLNDLATIFAKTDEENAEKNFKIQKAIGISQAAINTGLAVTAALTAGGNPIKLATGAQFVEAGIAAVAGAAQIAAIAKQKFGGAPSTAGDTPNVTEVNPAASLPTPQTTNGQSITPGGVESNSGQPAPLKAYVISTEVDNALQANQQIENLSRL